MYDLFQKWYLDTGHSIWLIPFSLQGVHICISESFARANLLLPNDQNITLCLFTQRFNGSNSRIKYIQEIDLLLIWPFYERIWRLHNFWWADDSLIWSGRGECMQNVQQSSASGKSYNWKSIARHQATFLVQFIPAILSCYTTLALCKSASADELSPFSVCFRA